MAQIKTKKQINNRQKQEHAIQIIIKRYRAWSNSSTQIFIDHPAFCPISSKFVRTCTDALITCKKHEYEP